MGQNNWSSALLLNLKSKNIILVLFKVKVHLCVCVSPQSKKLGYVSRGGDWVWHVAQEALASAFSDTSDVKWQLQSGPWTTRPHQIFMSREQSVATDIWEIGHRFDTAPFWCSAVSHYEGEKKALILNWTRPVFTVTQQTGRDIFYSVEPVFNACLGSLSLEAAHQSFQPGAIL